MRIAIRSFAQTAAKAAACSSSGLACAQELKIRPATPADYWNVADMHVSLFHPKAGASWQAQLLLDCLLSLQMDEALRDKGSGNAVCLVAYQRHAGTGTTTTPVRGAATPSSVAESQSKGSQAWPTAAAAEEAAMTSSSAAATTSISDQAAAQRAATGTTETRSSCLPATASTSTAAASEHGRHQFSWLRRFVRADVQAGINGGYGDAGLVGAAICDTFGNLIPPRTLDPVRDGAFGCVQRQGYAYMSNVMVAPSCRRRGLALQLVAHAEQTAAAWGCEHMALHVHPSNTAAVTLYRRLRYKSVALEARWQPWVHGRGMEGRCLLMVKRLPHLAPKPQA